MEISTQSNNVLCIKDIYIMDRTDELFISTPLQSRFMLDHKILDHGYPFQPKIMHKYKVDAEKADEYLDHCMTVFTEGGNIELYKTMSKINLLHACFDEINKNFYTNHYGHQSHTHHDITPFYNPYYVKTNNMGHTYGVEQDSDDELPLPTFNFRDKQ